MKAGDPRSSAWDSASDPWIPRSLGLRTDLMFLRREGIVRDLGDALAVRTPRLPTYWWGHVLIGKRMPTPEEVPLWLERYDAEVAAPSGVASIAITWDDPDPADDVDVEPVLAAFTEHELTPVRLVGLAAAPDAVATDRRGPDGLDVRPLHSDRDWAALLELQVLDRPPSTTEAGYRTYRLNRHALYREMISGGLGTWFGAFDGARGPLIGALGMFVEHGLGRYQAVVTHPEHRGRGVASALLAAAARWAARRRGARRLVIVAEQDSAGHRLYLSRGFDEVERSAGVSKPDAS